MAEKFNPAPHDRTPSTPKRRRGPIPKCMPGWKRG